MHGAPRRRAGLLVPRAGGPGRRAAGHDGRGPRRCRRHARAAPGGLPRRRRGAMRRVHARDADGDGRPSRPVAVAVRARGARRPGRGPVPLHRVHEDRRGGDGGCGRDTPRTRSWVRVARCREGRRGAHRPPRRSGQGHRCRGVRRRPAGHVRPHPARGPLAACPCPVHRRRPAGVHGGPSRPGAGAHRRGRAGREPLRHLRHRQGPARPRRRVRALRGRGGARARGGRRGRRADPRRGCAHRLDAAAGGLRHRGRAGRWRTAPPRGPAGERPRRGDRPERRRGPGARGLGGDGVGHVRDLVRGARVHRARGRDCPRRRRPRGGLGNDPDPVHGSRRAGPDPRPSRAIACG